MERKDNFNHNNNDVEATTCDPPDRSAQDLLLSDDVVREAFQKKEAHNKPNGKLIRAEKRRKWLAKKENKIQQQRIKQGRLSWIVEHSHFSNVVTFNEIIAMQKKKKKEEASSYTMLERYLTPYFDLKENNCHTSEHDMSNTHLNESGMDDSGNTRQAKKRRRISSNGCNKEYRNYFIAEGTETVRLLIQQFSKTSPKTSREPSSSKESLSSSSIPPIEIKSIFVKPAVFFDDPVSLIDDVNNCMQDTAPTVSNTVASSNKKPPFHVLIGTDDVISKVAGFPISRGALACGIIPIGRNEAWLFEEYLVNTMKEKKENNNNTNCQAATIHVPQQMKRKSRLRILALDGCSDTSNLGSIIRCASAFGIDAIIVSHDSCDVWYRRSIRVSMGHIVNVPVIRVNDIAVTIKKLQQSPYNIESYAGVCSNDDDTIVLENIHRHGNGDTNAMLTSPGWCCVMGNESTGVSKKVIDVCDYKIRIGMVDGIDSLSLPVATAILLHGLKERE